MQFYLAAGMGDTLPRGRFRPVRAAYRLGPRSAIGGGAVQGGMMLVGDSRECGPHDVLARDIIRECLRRNYDGVVLDWYHKGPDRGTLTALLGQLCPQYGLRLFVPEQYAPYAAQATVLLNTAVSGGTLAACLEDGIRRYGAGRLALDLERLRLDFTLPHSAGHSQHRSCGGCGKGRASISPRSCAPGTSPTAPAVRITMCCSTTPRPCGKRRRWRKTAASVRAFSCCRRWRTSPVSCWGEDSTRAELCSALGVRWCYGYFLK